MIWMETLEYDVPGAPEAGKVEWVKADVSQDICFYYGLVNVTNLGCLWDTKFENLFW